MKGLKTQVAVWGLLLLAGCGTDRRVSEVFTEVQERSESLQESSAVEEREPVAVGNRLQRVEGIWLGSGGTTRPRSETLPAALREDIVMVESGSLPLSEIGYRLAEQIGIPVAVDAALQAITITNLNYGGPANELLDRVAGMNNIYWTYDDTHKRIYVQQMLTRTFLIAALAQDVSLGSTVGGGANAGGEGTSGSANQTSSVSTGVQIWDDITVTLAALVGSEGEVIASPSTGNVVVTTTPRRMRAVEAYILQQNARRLRQVSIEVEVLSLSLNDSALAGFDLKATLGLGDKYVYGLDFGSSEAALGALTTSPLNTAMAQVFGTRTGADGMQESFVRREGIIRSLSEAGELSVVSRTVLETLSDQPVPFHVGREQAYLASVETSLQDGILQVSAEADTVSDGLTLQVLPRILENDQIMLAIAMTRRQLLSLESVATSGTEDSEAIQVPETSVQAVTQNVLMRSGDTLVLASTEQRDARRSVQGPVPGAEGFWFLGGSRGAVYSRTLTILVVTPHLSPSLSEEATEAAYGG